jgi:hypothetical protein
LSWRAIQTLKAVPAAVIAAKAIVVIIIVISYYLMLFVISFDGAKVRRFS